jgi:hypothetical protein
MVVLFFFSWITFRHASGGPPTGAFAFLAGGHHLPALVPGRYTTLLRCHRPAAFFFVLFFYSDPLHAKSASSRPRELEPLLEGEGDAFTFGLPRENYTYSMLRGLTLNFTRF